MKVLESELRRLQFRLAGMEQERRSERMQIYDLRLEIADLRGRLGAHRARLNDLEARAAE